MEIGRLTAPITADDKDFTSKMKAADALAAKTAKNITSHFDNVKMKIPGLSAGGIFDAAASLAGGNLITSVLQKVGGAITDAAKTGINFNKMIEGAQVALESMGMSADAAAKHIEELKSLALKTPFNFRDLLSASVTMNAFGFSIQSRIKDLKAITDAASIFAAASGDFKGSIEGIVLALGRMRTEGRASAREMIELGARGIPAWEILAKKMKMTVEEVKKLSEAGRLRGGPVADMLIEGMGQYAGNAGQKLAETILGKESNVQDYFEQRAGRDTEKLTEAYKNALDQATKTLEQDVGSKFTKEVANRAAANVSFWTQIFGGEFSAKEIGAALPGMMKDVFEELKGFVVNQGAAIGKGLGTGLLDGLKGMLSGSSAVQSIKDWVDAGKKTLQELWKWHSPSQVTEELGEALVDGLDQGVAKKIDKSSEGFKRWADRIKKDGGDAFVKAVESMANRLNMDPNKIMNVMAFESGLDPAKPGPGTATGLIQFLSSTAKKLGTTVEELKGMSAIEQLVYVEKYFAQFKDLADTQEAVYSAVLAGHGVKSPDQTLFLKGGTNTGPAYEANKKLDSDHDNKITAKEAAAKTYQQGFLTFDKSLDTSAVNLEKLAGGAGKATTTLVTMAEAPMRAAMAAAKVTMPESLRRLIDGDVRAPIELEKMPDNFNKLSDATKKSQAALNPMTVTMKELAPASATASEMMKRVTDATQEQIKAAKGINVAVELKEKLGKDVDSFLDELASGEKKFGDAMRGFVRTFITDILKSVEESIMQQMTGEKSFGAYFGKLIGGFLSGLFHFAEGGPTRANEAIIVGEKGPELFVPSTSGHIIPHEPTRQLRQQSQGMMQGGRDYGGVNIVINVPIHAPQGTVSPATRQQVAASTAQALNAALLRNS